MAQEDSRSAALDWAQSRVCEEVLGDREVGDVVFYQDSRTSSFMFFKDGMGVSGGGGCTREAFDLIFMVFVAMRHGFHGREN